GRRPDPARQAVSDRGPGVAGAALRRVGQAGAGGEVAKGTGSSQGRPANPAAGEGVTVRVSGSPGQRRGVRNPAAPAPATNGPTPAPGCSAPWAAPTTRSRQDRPEETWPWGVVPNATPLRMAHHPAEMGFAEDLPFRPQVAGVSDLQLSPHVQPHLSQQRPEGRRLVEVPVADALTQQGVGLAPAPPEVVPRLRLWVGQRQTLCQPPPLFREVLSLGGLLALDDGQDVGRDQ